MACFLTFCGFEITASAATPVRAAAVEQWTEIHRQDDLKWSRISGLSPRDVRRARIAAGIGDDLEGGRIDNLDSKDLAFRKQLLVVTSAGNGHCLTITVLTKKESVFQAVWSVDEATGVGGFCHDGAFSGNFEVHATKEGGIIVDVPRDTNNSGAFGGFKQLLYEWNGQTYVLSKRSKY